MSVLLIKKWFVLLIVLIVCGSGLKSLLRPKRTGGELRPSPASVLRVSTDNVGVVDIPDVTGFKQIVALSDAHGMADNLNKLLVAAKIIDGQQHWIAANTLLIVVGDSIDKGPHSLEILDLWSRLISQAGEKHGRVVVLLGNHEAAFLADPLDKKTDALREEAQDKKIPLDTLTSPTSPRGMFLRQMPVAARVGGKWLFCHAGWPPDTAWESFVNTARTLLQQGDYSNDFFLGEESILEKRAGRKGGKWWNDPKEVTELQRRLDADGLYGVVFGHQPLAFGIEGDVGPYDRNDCRLIKIDSGMAPDAGANPGHLLLFSDPRELTTGHKPTHLYSIGYDVNTGAPIQTAL